MGRKGRGHPGEGGGENRSRRDSCLIELGNGGTAHKKGWGGGTQLATGTMGKRNGVGVTKNFKKKM